MRQPPARLEAPAQSRSAFDAEVIAPTAPPRYHIWYEYPILDPDSFSTENPGTDATLADGVASIAPRSADALLADLANAELPEWRRFLTLNWLADDFPKEAPAAILKIAAGDSSDRLRRSAIVNLGVARLAGAGSLLSAIVQEDSTLRPPAIEALGRIGDPAHAAVVRPFLSGSDSKLNLIAVKAVENPKDADAVPALMNIVKTRKPDADYQLCAASANALVGIQGAPAYEALLNLILDSGPPPRVSPAPRRLCVGVRVDVDDGVAGLGDVSARRNEGGLGLPVLELDRTGLADGGGEREYGDGGMKLWLYGALHVSLHTRTDVRVSVAVETRP